ncbi:hypothetical protein C9374_006442 [Naegleria lovaniensis]|uniref:Uncharacterized protein n=1 Tax=Naegleria lovaniensis TaxID=51637 RepID=A0AA88KJ58_NAELO|nr:uncharacterized protein C9374_006442 [Naegleria lovaniensis]KAG2381453.1 hypothetical protein C9374_006442 [Naegleria lovaniensis]
MEILKTPEIEQCLQSVKNHLVQYGMSSTENTLRVQIDQYDQEDYVSFDVLKRTVEFKNERMQEDDQQNNNANNHKKKSPNNNNTNNAKKITSSNSSSASSEKTQASSTSPKTYLHKLIKGTKLRTKTTSTTPTKKNPEWVKLTEQLRKKQGDYEYSKLVRNVVNAPAHEREALNSYKGQLSVGLDLVITMATLFVVFYTASQYMFTGENKKQYQILMGLIGLILGLLIDAVLVIVRGKKAEMIDKVQTKHKNIATNSYGIETVPIE